MEANKLYVAQIIRDSDQKVVSQSRPMMKRMADKCEDGMGINLNWNDYRTQVVEAPDED